MRRLLSALFTVAPFVAGAVAVLSARHDIRMLWMAAAATMAARVVLAAAPARWDPAVGVGTALVAAVTAAAGVAVLLGARGAVGAGMVAVVLAGCATAGAALGRRPPAAV